jgi:hypothetical protein
MLQTILIVLLILFLLGGLGTLPNWSHSRNWGYGPSGGMGLIGIIVLSSWFCHPCVIVISPSSSCPKSVATLTSFIAITAAHRLCHHLKLIVIFYIVHC